tara:strand:- start:149365 stop:150645 length:1281 start_codon:yes stop_codon:yes gene_type:complete
MKKLNEIIKNYRTTTLSSFKEDALVSIESNGIPYSKQENWKYTNLKKFISEDFNFLKKPESFSSSTDETLFKDHHQIVFEDGHLNPNKTKLPSGCSLKEQSIESQESNISKNFPQDQLDFFEGLSRLVNNNLYSIEVDKKAIIDNSPIIIHHTYSHQSEGSWVQPIIIIECGAFSQSTFVEIYHGKENQIPSFTNASTSFVINENAIVEHVKVQIEDTQSIHISKVRAKVLRDATFHSFTLSLGSLVARQNILVDIDGENSNSHIHGFFGARGNQHHDIFSHINHHVGHNESHQLVKGILDDEARGVFTGKIMIHRDAQLVDSTQLNKNILLGPKSHMDTRPQLEVYADDVKCAHGATIGQIDPEEIFYLQSRGIKLHEAQKMLCHAFAFDTLEKIKSETVRESLAELLYEKFEKYALEHFGEGKE